MPMKKKKGMVYEVPCKECDVVHIGETGRTMEKRLAEHKYARREVTVKMVLLFMPIPLYMW